MLIYRFIQAGIRAYIVRESFNIREGRVQRFRDSDVPSKTRVPPLPTYLPGSRSTRLSVAG